MLGRMQLCTWGGAGQAYKFLPGKKTRKYKRCHLSPMGVTVPGSPYPFAGFTSPPQTQSSSQSFQKAVISPACAIPSAWNTFLTSSPAKSHSSYKGTSLDITSYKKPTRLTPSQIRSLFWAPGPRGLSLSQQWLLWVCVPMTPISTIGT